MVSKVLDSQRTASGHFCDRLHVIYRHLDREKRATKAQSNAGCYLCGVSTFVESRKFPFARALHKFWKILNRDTRFPLFHTSIWKSRVKESNSNRHSLSYVESQVQDLPLLLMSIFCPSSNNCRESTRVCFQFHTASMVVEQAPRK